MLAKKILTLVCASCAAFALTACDSSVKFTTETATPSASESPTTTPTVHRAMTALEEDASPTPTVTATPTHYVSKLTKEELENIEIPHILPPSLHYETSSKWEGLFVDDPNSVVYGIPMLDSNNYGVIASLISIEMPEFKSLSATDRENFVRGLLSQFGTITRFDVCVTTMPYSWEADITGESADETLGEKTAYAFSDGTQLCIVGWFASSIDVVGQDYYQIESTMQDRFLASIKMGETKVFVGTGNTL